MKNLWVVFLVFLGVFFLSLLGWSFYRANMEVSKVTDKEYSSRGHQYASTDRQLAEAEKLGWEILCTRQGEHLKVRLNRADGKPVSGAEGEIEFLQNESDTNASIASLLETETGVYVVQLPAAARAETHGRLSLSKDGALLQKKVIIFQ